MKNDQESPFWLINKASVMTEALKLARQAERKSGSRQPNLRPLSAHPISWPHSAVTIAAVTIASVALTAVLLIGWMA